MQTDLEELAESFGTREATHRPLRRSRRRTSTRRPTRIRPGGICNRRGRHRE